MDGKQVENRVGCEVWDQVERRAVNPVWGCVKKWAVARVMDRVLHGVNLEVWGQVDVLVERRVESQAMEEHDGW
jgi:hypothetical protein